MSMAEWSTFDLAVLAWAALALPVLAATLRRTAPYGRHRREGWGPSVPAVPAWIAMEAVSLVVFSAFLWAGLPGGDGARWALGALYCGHYLNRTLLYPLRSRMAGTTMPVSVMAMAMVFNSINASLNGWGLFHQERVYGAGWLTDPRFLVGVGLFGLGMFINLRADATLRALRRPGETHYAVPRGGLYRWISCPNYFGEIVEWIGFAVAAWSLPALSFALWTVANLAPRARAHHRWYRTTFPDYPQERRALVPFFW